MESVDVTLVSLTLFYTLGELNIDKHCCNKATILDKTVKTLGQVTTNLQNTDQFFNPPPPFNVVNAVLLYKQSLANSNPIKQHERVGGEGDEILFTRLQVKKLANNKIRL